MAEFLVLLLILYVYKTLNVEFVLLAGASLSEPTLTWKTVWWSMCEELQDRNTLATVVW